MGAVEPCCLLQAAIWPLCTAQSYNLQHRSDCAGMGLSSISQWLSAHHGSTLPVATTGSCSLRFLREPVLCTCSTANTHLAEAPAGQLAGNGLGGPAILVQQQDGGALADALQGSDLHRCDLQRAAVVRQWSVVHSPGAVCAGCASLASASISTAAVLRSKCITPQPRRIVWGLCRQHGISKLPHCTHTSLMTYRAKAFALGATCWAGSRTCRCCEQPTSPTGRHGWHIMCWAAAA